MNFLKDKRTLFLLLIILVLGTLLRFYSLNFGLPHSFRADEPEIVEPAIYYTFQIRDIIKNNDYYKLIPISYVYGAFPNYFFAFVIMAASKTHNLLNVSFPKENMYLLVRAAHAFLSLSLVFAGAKLYKQVFKNKEGVLFAALFLALNWKLIVHGHYANADLIITALLTFSFIPLYSYFKGNKIKLNLLLVSLLFGLALGTKITVLITAPLFLYIFAIKKDWRAAAGFILITALTFLVTNPFALIFSDDFFLRVMQMATKESGMALDSVDSSPYKYLASLFYTVTPLLAALSFVGIYKKIKEKTETPIHIFLIGHIIIYVLFFSLGNRRVDRWLLPVLPIMILYGTYGLHKISSNLNTKAKRILVLLIIASVSYFPILLLGQFARQTPKSEAYLWMRDNVEHLSTKLVITNEGLDPMNKLKFAEVSQYPVYTPEGAQFFDPPSPTMYDYVVLSSRPMENFKRPEVVEAFPTYVDRMEEFENTILDPNNFRLIKSFTLTKPNLIPLSDIYIYENVNSRDSL
ncbi:DUF2029 domain-containing protein [candidate division WWE3 bacterium]|jgi:hypothetical protein|nr:DUF2029 domain-containing protein [candidate division WWE3 bacterium]MBT7350257.1 DUF2029 domain-containing protein [candidate division WWE3 bacterium]